jgi:hypothetical protein
MIKDFLKMWGLLFVAVLGFMILSTLAIAGVGGSLGPFLGGLCICSGVGAITGWISWVSTKDVYECKQDCCYEPIPEDCRDETE